MLQSQTSLPDACMLCGAQGERGQSPEVSQDPAAALASFPVDLGSDLMSTRSSFESGLTPVVCPCAGSSWWRCSWDRVAQAALVLPCGACWGSGTAGVTVWDDALPEQFIVTTSLE